MQIGEKSKGDFLKSPEVLKEVIYQIENLLWAPEAHELLKQVKPSYENRNKINYLLTYTKDYQIKFYNFFILLVARAIILIFHLIINLY